MLTHSRGGAGRNQERESKSKAWIIHDCAGRAVTSVTGKSRISMVLRVLSLVTNESSTRFAGIVVMNDALEVLLREYAVWPEV